MKINSIINEKIYWVQVKQNDIRINSEMFKKLKQVVQLQCLISRKRLREGKEWKSWFEKQNRKTRKHLRS